MKRCLSLLLILSLLLSGCADAASGRSSVDSHQQSVPTEPAQPGENSATESENGNQAKNPAFHGLGDPELRMYAQDLIYDELVSSLNDDGYFVENVSAVYVSQEYLDELAFNSQSNIFFGYTLDELNAQFQGARYVFTLNENGETDVQPFEEYNDTFSEVIQNVALGAGVILICATVSVVSVAGAPAVSVIFASAAKTGTVFALASGLLGGLSAGIVKGIETGNFEDALAEAALVGSKGLKWGAFAGTIIGGTSKASALKGATRNGLTMNEAAAIQMESRLGLDVIKSLHSADEYNVYKNAGLLSNEININGRTVLAPDIDWDFIGDIEDGRTNAQRIAAGLAPLDPSGHSYEVHHIGQKNDGPLAILPYAVHKKNYSILHANTGSSPSEVDHGSAFQAIKKQIWKTLFELGG